MCGQMSHISRFIYVFTTDLAQQPDCNEHRDGAAIAIGNPMARGR
jgi:hypothetical protein